ncbi:MAG: hypothetical protein ACLQOO_08680 [Terriglobia bacterium]|jgi:hypothetical protein
MSTNLTIISDGKKFLWDGQPYDSKEAASSAAQSYQNDNFQVQTVEEDGKFLVYTRRVIKEWVAATQ